jgi:hypothetical protein
MQVLHTNLFTHVGVNSFSHSSPKHFFSFLLNLWHSSQIVNVLINLFLQNTM